MNSKSSRLVDLTGKTFGKITALSFHSRAEKTGHAIWLVKCSCGKEFTVKQNNLSTGHTKSCGCLKMEKATGNKHSFKHGHGAGARSSEFNIWVGMKQRCHNPKATGYIQYGGRGIQVCDRWLNSFENFLADMGLKPSSNHTIERTDTDGDYCPENCIWLKAFDQQSNRRNNVKIEHNGEILTATEWERKMGVTPGRIHSRIWNGWSPVDAITTPTDTRYSHL